MLNENQKQFIEEYHSKLNTVGMSRREIMETGIISEEELFDLHISDVIWGPNPQDEFCCPYTTAEIAINSYQEVDKQIFNFKVCIENNQVLWL